MKIHTYGEPGYGKSYAPLSQFTLEDWADLKYLEEDDLERIAALAALGNVEPRMEAWVYDSLLAVADAAASVKEGAPLPGAPSFTDAEGHVWTVEGPALVAGYTNVTRDDGLRSCRATAYLRIPQKGAAPTRPPSDT